MAGFGLMTPEETRLFGKTLGAIARRLDALRAEELVYLREVPIQQAIGAFRTSFEAWGHDRVGADVEAVDGEVQLAGGAEWARTYWQLVVLHLVARTLQQDRSTVLTAPLREFLLRDLERIVDSATPGTVPDDPLGDPAFILDLGLSRGAVLPFDDMLVVPRYLEDPNFTEGTWLEFHVRSGDFDLDSLMALSTLVEDYLLLNPHIQGLYAIGWMMDPDVAEVSPHLGWVREFTANTGADISHVGTNEETVTLATSTSATRRAAFEEGRFAPTNHLVMMSRDVLVTFFESMRDQGTP